MSKFINNIRQTKHDSNSVFTFLQDPGDIIDQRYAKPYWSTLFNNAPGTYLVEEWIGGIAYFSFIYIIMNNGEGFPIILLSDIEYPFLSNIITNSKTNDGIKTDTITMQYNYIWVNSEGCFDVLNKNVTYTFTTKSDGTTSLAVTEKKDDYSGAGTYAYITKMADWSFVD